MNLKRLLFMLMLIIGTTLVFYSLSYAVSLEEGYDDEILTEEGTTSWEDDLEALEEREIERILTRIRAGDTNVLNYIVYQVFERLHYTILAISLPRDHEGLLNRLRERYTGEDAERFVDRAKRRYANLEGQSYYRIVGYRNSIRAFLAGFNNQDPKVRLKCIGYLGDWVDEIGLDLITIETAVGIRLGSGLETRAEVKYALEILRLKILRKRILKQIYLGDTNVLDEIPARDFVVLVKNEEFIRRVYRIPDSVRIRSIKLDPYVESREGNKEDAIRDNNVADKLWRLDSYDFNYNNRNAFRAIFAGLENPSLFVKENVVRLMLEIVFRPDNQQDPNNPGVLIEDPVIVNGRVTNGILADMSRQAAYIRLAQKTWDDVIFAVFGNPDEEVVYTGIDNTYFDTGRGSINNTRCIEPDQCENHIVTVAPVTNEGDGTELTVEGMGHYNYRVMVADLLRLMGLQWYLGEEEQEVVTQDIVVESVEHLFDNLNYAGIIDRADFIEGEAPLQEEQ
jgi:hypothetical protein